MSQLTLSEQVAELEHGLGQSLFERRGRQLHLTEAGTIAFEHAESIFATGRELLDRMRQAKSERKVLRIGAVGPLSKNLQYDFVEPLLQRGDTRICVVSGALKELVRQLHEHQLDLVLSSLPCRRATRSTRFTIICWAKRRCFWRYVGDPQAAGSISGVALRGSAPASDATKPGARGFRLVAGGGAGGAEPAGGSGRHGAAPVAGVVGTWIGPCRASWWSANFRRASCAP